MRNPQILFDDDSDLGRYLIVAVPPWRSSDYPLLWMCCGRQRAYEEGIKFRSEYPDAKVVWVIDMDTGETVAKLNGGD